MKRLILSHTPAESLAGGTSYELDCKHVVVMSGAPILGNTMECPYCQRPNQPQPKNVTHTLTIEAPIAETLDQVIDRIKDAYFPKLPEQRKVRLIIIAKELEE